MIVNETPEQAKKQKIPDEYIKSLPDVRTAYQRWYSEALACISVVLPTRASDFIALYKPDKPRKEISYSNYTISDYLKGVSRTRYDGARIVHTDAALSPMQQQVAIMTAAKQRFNSSLFDIRALVQADLFYNELDTAEELDRKGAFKERRGQSRAFYLKVILQPFASNIDWHIRRIPPSGS